MTKVTLPRSLKPKKANPELLQLSTVPKALHGLNPRTLLGQEWWDKTRRKAYSDANYYCEACNAKSRKPLEAHEVYSYDERRHKAKYTGVVAICHKCHNFIHLGRLNWLWESGRVDHNFVCAVLEHAIKVLTEANLSPNPDSVPLLTAWDCDFIPPRKHSTRSGGIGVWHKWTLEVEGKIYNTKFHSYEAWMNWSKRR